MPARKRAASEESSSSDEVITLVGKVIGLKKELDKIRKDRENKRAQLRRDLDDRIKALRKRIKETTTAHTKQLGAITKQQVGCLVQAVAARDAIERSIRDRLAELQEESTNLAGLLDTVYQRRIEKTQATMTEDAARRPLETSDKENRPNKKVKLVA